MNRSNAGHLSPDLIYRTLDDELATSERFACESHLAVCELCRRKLASLREFSIEIEAAVLAGAVLPVDSVRQAIQTAIEAKSSPSAGRWHHPSKVMLRFGWGMAIAATLALGVLVAPKLEITGPPLEPTVPHAAATVQTSAIEVDGETFLPVPYSNSDLPMAAPHIVQMQVPISSLADVGIVLEPVANRMGVSSDSERSVLADVLVGVDGQPRGVHVLSSE